MMYDMTIGTLFRQAYSCGPAYAGVALGTVSLYSVFTLGVTQWRTQFRVNMNKVTLVIWPHGIVDKVGVALYVTFHHGRDQKVRVCPVHWRLVVVVQVWRVSIREHLGC